MGRLKTLDDITCFDDATIDQLGEAARQLLQSGQPMEIPAALPMGQIVQIAKTMISLRDRVKALEAEVDLLQNPGGPTASGIPHGVDPRQLDLSDYLPPMGE